MNAKVKIRKGTELNGENYYYGVIEWGNEWETTTPTYWTEDGCQRAVDKFLKRNGLQEVKE